MVRRGRSDFNVAAVDLDLSTGYPNVIHRQAVLGDCAQNDIESTATGPHSYLPGMVLFSQHIATHNLQRTSLSRGKPSLWC